ncbi:MAG TPA: hypothetical protein VJU87_10230 [Gemmatimonadaceae bacterium]|nr:hypothetical protein [Gemmatimonadaceae bacterium]
MERSERYEDETGAGTGDLRENDPHAPGFTEDDDRLFRSHFQHANQIADRSYEHVRSAYRLGFEAAADARYAGHSFDEIERDLEGGWLNERTALGDWQSVRDYARLAFERGRALGYISSTEFLAGTRSHQRASYSDPVPDNMDPTSPQSPEQTLEYQHEDHRGPEWTIRRVGATADEAPGDVRESPMGSTGEEMVHPPEE